MADALLENPRALAESVAGALGGTAVAHTRLTGFLSSGFDPFLNQLFAHESVTPRDIADALAGKPAFVWLAEKPEAGDTRLVVMHGMTATTSPPSAAGRIDGEVVKVRSTAELDAWHEVYCDVLGADPRGRDDWRRVHAVLGPSGDTSLLLLLATVDGTPAATGAVFYGADAAGLYCFATRERMRGRGLASALVHACHAAARARGIERALLQATDSGRPVYARAGYREERALPVLRCR
jgi:GNAT superfamily N-acetyltransferase